MKEIVEALKKRISENENSMLVTVVAGRGSIPRKAGAYMVVGEDGRVTGTIGGGNRNTRQRCWDKNFLRKRKIICMSIILFRKNLQNLEWHAAEMRQCCFILWMSGKMPYGSDRWKRQKKKEKHSGS